MRVKIGYLLFFLIPVLAACSAGPSASDAIEAYLSALVEGDQLQALNNSCVDWESQAKAEAASFEAVEARLEGVSCSLVEGGENEGVVECAGSILATYGAEVQELKLQGRSYIVTFEAGDWRMCGYQ
ncbi:MAG: hypothetical protein IIC78_10785 [Chloroflexi bacterium]|nr:hypothetical protein [Chloroflexota bacterium]